MDLYYLDSSGLSDILGQFVTESYRITISSSLESDQEPVTGDKEMRLQWTKRQITPRNDGDRVRKKRAGVRQEVSIERKQPRCQQKLQQMKAGSSEMPIQLVRMVETGETTKFTCHYCGDGRTKFVSMVWHHLQRDRESGAFSLIEVSLDMHDDESLNRVTVETDHTLVIRRAKKEDAGTYFCRDYTKSDKLLKAAMTPEDIVSLITDKLTFRFLYHFDVLLPSEMDVREISRVPGNSAKSPAEPQIIGKLNLLMDTSWERWGACSTCGSVGERKRLGLCKLKKKDVNKEARPWYIHAVMTSYPAGVPCRSSLFQGHPEVKPRPDELEAEACEVKCVEGISMGVGKASAMSVEGIEKSISFEQKSGVTKSNKIRSLAVDEGSAVELNCSGVPIDWTVVWTNNTRLIDFNVSDDRVTLHANNVLEIYPVAPWDSATYHCLSQKEVKVKIKLTVVPSLKMDTVTWLYAYFLSLTYPGDFILFLILMVIKHRHRRTGRRLNKAELRDMESYSSRGSLEEWTTSSSGSY